MALEQGLLEQGKSLDEKGGRRLPHPARLGPHHRLARFAPERLPEFRHVCFLC
jgi:hypothetical protein